MSRPKPANPVLNPTHAFSVNLLAVVPFTEGTGLPGILTLPGAPAVIPAALTVDGSGGTPTWTTNSAGTCVSLVAPAAYFINAGSTDWIKPSTAGVTVCLIRRKTDTTARATITFGTNDTGTGRLCLLCPYNDGTVYWDYGGNSGINSLVIPSLTFPTTVESFVFTAGPAGLYGWRNGVSIGSSASDPGVATAQGVNLGINTPVFGTERDLVEFNYLAVYNTQWTDALIAAWTADPYANLYAGSAWRSAFGARKRRRA